MLIYLDTNALIAALEGTDAVADLVRDVLKTVRSGRVAFVASELVLAELLVEPLRASDIVRIRAALALFGAENELIAAPVSRDILLAAADLRASRRSLKLPDAIHLATALSEACSLFLSNDQRLPALPRLHQVPLQEQPLRDLLTEAGRAD